MIRVWCSRFQFFHDEQIGPSECIHDGEAYRDACDYFIYVAA